MDFLFLPLYDGETVFTETKNTESNEKLKMWLVQYLLREWGGICSFLIHESVFVKSLLGSNLASVII